MPIIISRPGAINFTDNQARYYILGDFTAPSQKLQVRVFVIDSGTPKATLLYPPYLGIAAPFNIEDVVKPYTRFFRPRIDGSYYSAIQAATGHRVSSWIEYRIFDPTSDTNPPFDSDSDNKCSYIRGGYGLWNRIPNWDFEHRRKWFFTWQREDFLVSNEEPHWLLYCHPVGQPCDLEYTVIYTDGTEAVERFAFTPSDEVPAERQFDLWFIPTGIEQNALQEITPGKKIHRYVVRMLQRSNDRILAAYRYRVDYRPNYDKFLIYFRNSLGGWDALRILGEWESGAGYSHKEHKRGLYDTTVPDYNGPGTTPYYEIKERRRWTINTGHMGRDQLDALRDLMRSKEIATIISGSWVPLRITNDELSGINTRNALQNTTIELETSYENENYTPDKLPWEV